MEEMANVPRAEMKFSKKFPVRARIHYRSGGTAEPKKGTVIEHVLRPGFRPYARVLLDGSSRVTIAWPEELRRLKPLPSPEQKRISQLENLLAEVGKKVMLTIGSGDINMLRGVLSMTASPSPVTLTDIVDYLRAGAYVPCGRYTSHTRDEIATEVETYFSAESIATREANRKALEAFARDPSGECAPNECPKCHRLNTERDDFNSSQWNMQHALRCDGGEVPRSEAPPV